MRLGPLSYGTQRNQQGTAELGQGVFEVRWVAAQVGTGEQAVSLLNVPEVALPLAASYLGFLAATSLGHGWGAPAVAAVSVVCTIGEIIYAGSATALVTASLRRMSRGAPSPASSSRRVSASPSPRRSSPLSPPTARPPSGAVSPL